MIFDSTRDVSHGDQISQILRYVKIEGTQVRVVGFFVDFLEEDGKTGEKIAELILEKLEKDGLDIQNCRGQAYDNASNTAGKDKGVQARIREVSPEAQFVACTNHSLSRVGAHAASKVSGSMGFFGTLEAVFIFFSASTTRWRRLINVMERGVKRLIEQRCSSSYEVVSEIRLSDILNVIFELANPQEIFETRTAAISLLPNVRKFSFVCFLGFWSEVLREISNAQLFLQTRGIGLHRSAIKIAVLEG